MDLFDVHAHLELIPENQIQGVISRAEEKNVRTIITNSVNSETGKKALELQEKHSIVRAALGIYPGFASKISDQKLQQEIEFIEANKNNLVALGEIGLDYQESEDRKKQHKALELQLELAEDFDVPVLVHTRKAEKETVEILIRKKHPKTILHAFHGNMKLVKSAADAGIAFSIPTNVVRSHHFAKMVEIVPLENLFTETDTPYLGPEKDGYSEPSYVEKTIKKIAEIRNIGVNEAAEQIYENSKKNVQVKPPAKTLEVLRCF